MSPIRTSAELYDPVSGTWSATGSMLKPHDGFGATLLRDGKVLVGDVDDPVAAGTTDHRRRGVRPGERDLDRHREDGRDATPAGTLLRDGKVLVRAKTAPSCTTPTAGPGPPRGR